MDAIESGLTTGEVARAMNTDGLQTRRGKRWTARAVRDVALNEDYTRTTRYPALIDAARHERIVELVHRSDIRSREGGRHAVEPNLFRGMASCALCGAPLYTRRLAAGRHYTCRNVRQATGVVRRPPDSRRAC